MQLKYNRQPGYGSTIVRILIKLILISALIVVGIFLIEKINFPSPEKNQTIDITNEIKQLK